MARSFVVMTHADDDKRDERKGRYSQTIRMKDGRDFSIPLQGKKLLFVSSKYAYAAKACMKDETKNGDEEYHIEKNPLADERSPTGYCYRENRLANSDLLTRKMIEKSDKAAEERKEDVNRLVHVASGMHALEEELKQYGEKFASAVRSHAIIQSVEQILKNMELKATSFTTKNEQDVRSLDDEIKGLKEECDKIIEDVRKKFVGKPDESDRERLWVSSTKTTEMTDDIKTNADRILGKAGTVFNKGKVKGDEETKIQNEIEGMVSDLHGRFLGGSSELLKEKASSFTKEVFDRINASEQISDLAKKYLEKVESPEEPQTHVNDRIKEIYQDAITTKKFLWFKERSYLNKESFLRGFGDETKEILEDVADDYQEVYQNQLTELLGAVGDDFISRIEEYSGDVQAKIADRDSMKELGEEFKEIAKAVREKIDKLNAEIWQEAKNV